MGKRLTDNDRAFRMISRPNLRKLQRKGRCFTSICRRDVAKGEHSLRFMTVVHGRSQEVGICSDCIGRIWPEVEDIVGRLSLEVDEMRREIHGDDDVLPDGPEEMQEMQDEVYKDLGIDQ